MIAVLVLLALVVLRVLLVAGFALVLIPVGRVCPACGAETVPLERTGLARLMPRIERRWCVACGWSWFRKRSRAPEVSRASRPGALPFGGVSRRS